MSEIGVEGQDENPHENLNEEEKVSNVSLEENISDNQKFTEEREVTSEHYDDKEGNHKATKTHDIPDIEKNESLSSHFKFILDIPLQVSVELGRSRMFIQDLLKLNVGSIIELNKQVGEPFDVLVNDKLVARGEVVMVNDRLGVRIVDIISPTERVQQLQ